jgi:hypothetical protein
MRKFLALAVCWILAFSAGYMILPSSATGLINWLSPVFGTSLHVTLSTLFLLFGDPLVYTSLALAWGIVGFVGGFIIPRSTGGSRWSSAWPGFASSRSSAPWSSRPPCRTR